MKINSKYCISVITIIIAIICSSCSYKSVDAEIEKSDTLNYEESVSESSQTDTLNTFNNDDIKVIEVDGGDLSGFREAAVKVDIGYGDRTYWAYTNEFGQLVRVEAKEIILQNPNEEGILPTGRYYRDEAKVPGVESPNLDEGHVIADSLGGVSNAYNITPQNSTLNRHGDQAYMEKVIRDAGGCTNFIAEITYPDTSTQIPSHYKYSYILNGENIVDEFDNINPDEANRDINNVETSSEEPVENHDIATVDKNGNGIVTIKEAKAAGYKMPISKNHWLYPYMIDKDGDGLVGE